jgi:hypothetical protein
MRLALVLLAFAGFLRPVLAADEVVPVTTADGTSFSYVLTTTQPQQIRYAVILMPGGSGRLDPRMNEGRVVMVLSGNFLIRSRALFAGHQFVAASTDATTTPSRINAIVADLERRYGKLAVYVAGTSNSSNATLDLAEKMDGQVAGFIHTSSFSRIASFDPRRLKSRNLIVFHEQDGCKFTSPSHGQASHNKYGTDLIAMTGGRSTGDECEAYAHHGYYMIEAETVDRIKAWILKGT